MSECGWECQPSFGNYRMRTFARNRAAKRRRWDLLFTFAWQKLATARIPAPALTAVVGNTHGVNRLDPTEMEGDLHSDFSSCGWAFRTMDTLNLSQNNTDDGGICGEALNIL